VIPGEILAKIFEEWKEEYGPTFPLYGNNTVRSDISGSVRPLLSSTEIPHTKVLSEISGVPKKTIQKIVSGDMKEVDFETADVLITAMERVDVWYDERYLGNHYE